MGNFSEKLEEILAANAEAEAKASAAQREAERRRKEAEDAFIGFAQSTIAPRFSEAMRILQSKGKPAVNNPTGPGPSYSPPTIGLGVTGKNGTVRLVFYCDGPELVAVVHHSGSSSDRPPRKGQLSVAFIEEEIVALVALVFPREA